MFKRIAHEGIKAVALLLAYILDAQDWVMDKLMSGLEKLLDETKDSDDDISA